MICSKPLLKINSEELKHLTKGKTYISYKWFPDKKNFNSYLRRGSVQIIGCRICKNCLNMKRYQWVKKMSYEKLEWKHTYFITLTYDELNVPNELNKKDLSNFIKYLRNEINEPLKYFACGEYGSKTERPHYHLILFTNYDLDLIWLKNTNTGPLYESKLLNKCWLNKGYIWVAHDLDNMSFAYVSAYSNKQYLKTTQNYIWFLFKEKRDDLYSKENGSFKTYLKVEQLIPKFKQPEFITMSKYPPLGSSAKKISDLPSSLLKWKKEQLLKNNNVDDFFNNPFYCELKKRQKEFIIFLKNKNVRDILYIEELKIYKNNSLYLKGSI